MKLWQVNCGEEGNSPSGKQELARRRHEVRSVLETMNKKNHFPGYVILPFRQKGFGNIVIVPRGFPVCL